MAPRPEDLRRHFEQVYRTRMQGLPFLNPRLQVAALGFRAHGGDEVGVLLTPWFMNLVVLPGDPTAWPAQGAAVDYALPAGAMGMTVHRDESVSAWLSAVLYRDVSAIPDMHWARRLADDILARLFAETTAPAPVLSRRALLAGP